MVGNECHFRKGQVVGVDYKPRIDMSLAKLKMLYCDRVDLYSEQFRISESRHIKFDFWFDNTAIIYSAYCHIMIITTFLS